MQSETSPTTWIRRESARALHNHSIMITRLQILFLIAASPLLVHCGSFTQMVQANGRAKFSNLSSIDGSSVQTIDISSSGRFAGTGRGFLHTQTLPAGLGFVGLTGTIAIDDPVALTFDEVLLEIGYSDTCDVGNFQFAGGYDYNNTHLTNATYLSAFIVKANAQGHTEVPIDYTLPSAAKMGGCFFVDYSSDIWMRPGAPAARTIALTNDLRIKVVPMTESSNISIEEGFGGGGEFCVGTSDAGCNSAQGAVNTYKTVTQFDRNATLLSLVGTISNAPFAADGRFTTISGDWQSEDLYYFAPNCSGQTPGYSGPASDNFRVPASATILLDLNLSGNGPESVAQTQVYQPVNITITPNDCLVHIFHASSNGVVDMETQLSAVMDNTPGTSALITSSPAAPAAPAAPVVVATPVPADPVAPAAPAPAPVAVAPAAPVATPNPFVDSNGNGLVSGASYVVQNIASSQCLDVTGGRVVNGVRIQQYSCNGSANQSWQLVVNGDGTFSFLSAVSGKALDFDASSLPTNGTKVQQWDFGSSANQRFNLTTSSGGYSLSSVAAGVSCLDVPADTLAVPGTKLQVWDCNGGAQQAFRFIRQ